MNKVLFLGFPSSGKTVLLAAFANWLSKLNASHIAFLPKTPEAHQFLLKVPSNLRDGFWPPQTDHSEVERLAWDLTLDGKCLAQVESLDYPGEAFLAYAERETKKQDDVRMKTCEKALEQLDGFIAEAGAVFLLINYARLRELSDAVRAHAASLSEAEVRSAKMNELIDYIWKNVSVVEKLLNLKTHPSVTLVLTQCDRFPDIDDFRAALLNIDPMFEKITHACGVCAVSSVGRTEMRIIDGAEKNVPCRDSAPIGMYEFLLHVLEASDSGRKIIKDLRDVHRKLQQSADECEGRLCLSPISKVVEEADSLVKYLPLVTEEQSRNFRNNLERCKTAIRRSGTQSAEEAEGHLKNQAGTEIEGNARSKMLCCVAWGGGLFLLGFLFESFLAGLVLGGLVGGFKGFNLRRWVADKKQRLRRAAEGDAIAEYELGLDYYLGRGVKQSYKRAFYWFCKAAEQGHNGAENMKGVCWVKGQGVECSYPRAIACFKNAANHGNSLAWVNLGNRYFEGQGFEKSAKDAVRCYRKAADANDAEGLYRLGMCYENGDGVGVSKEKALNFYGQAAGQKHKEAKKAKARLAQQIGK